MEVSKFSKPTLRKLRKEIEDALASVSVRHGIHIKTGRCSFMDSSATMKLEMAVIGADGVVHTKEAEAFRNFAGMYDLKRDDLGQKFVAGGTTYEIIGLKTRARKRPILCLSEDNGKTYVFEAEAVIRFLGRKPVVPEVTVIGEEG